MFVFPRWSTTLFAFAMTAAAAAYAQDRDPPRPPPHGPAFEAAMDDCWVDYGGEPDDPVPPDMMAECMASKGFPPPPHRRPPPHGAPFGDDDDDLFGDPLSGPFAGP
ncbi:hypothetical protein [Luteibacter sp.]|jgi:hypothetical protein|uniref:hypothetical protein n=1 Tax=Luteibacter sp. TaxID=1886636 RepID=UPI003F7EA8CC